MEETLKKSANLARNGSVPTPPKKLSAREQKIWNYIVEALAGTDFDLTTSGLLLMIIMRTYIDWEDSVTQLERYKKANGGSYMSVTPNGYEQPCQLFFACRQLKNELLKWLPEACLTVVSLTRTKKVQESDVRQGDLFTEEMKSFMDLRPSIPEVSETTH